MRYFNSNSTPLRPLTGVSAGGGIRPGVYAGLAAGEPDARVSGPLMGLLLDPPRSRRCVAANGSPVNGARQTAADWTILSPGVNAGPITACGGKGRERPWKRRVDAAAKRRSAISNHKSVISNRKSVISNRKSVISNRKSEIPLSRRGFTLVEMLIVIGIMLLLVAAAATIMPAAAESRRIREAGRGLNVYLGSARNRAMETGRPCGVIFHCIPGTLSAINLDQCEVPPQYAGQNTNSTASVTLSGAGTVSLTFSDGAFSSTSGVPVYPGDLIQLNGQGVFYTVAGSASNNVDSTTGRLSNVGSASAPLIATFDTTQGQIVPWTTTPTTLPYCIFRSPMKSGATPLQLPSGAVVDLRDSGVGSNYIGATYATMTTFTVLFSPTGAVDRVYYDTTQATVTDPIYLMVGKRDRAAEYLRLQTTATNRRWPTCKTSTISG